VEEKKGQVFDQKEDSTQMENFVGGYQKRKPNRMKKSEDLTPSKRGHENMKCKRSKWHDRQPLWN